MFVHRSRDGVRFPAPFTTSGPKSPLSRWFSSTASIQNFASRIIASSRRT